MAHSNRNNSNGPSLQNYIQNKFQGRQMGYNFGNNMNPYNQDNHNRFYANMNSNYNSMNYDNYNFSGNRNYQSGMYQNFDYQGYNNSYGYSNNSYNNMNYGNNRSNFNNYPNEVGERVKEMYYERLMEMNENYELNPDKIDSQLSEFKRPPRNAKERRFLKWKMQQQQKSEAMFLDGGGPRLLNSARPIQGGRGMNMLQKMGWNPGQGLGRNNMGPLEPTKIKLKWDKNGLSTRDERRETLMKQNNSGMRPRKFGKKKNSGGEVNVEGKSPIMVLSEYCAKKKIPPPVYSVLEEEGAIHERICIMKVELEGKEYQGTQKIKKKLAKAEVAEVCAKSLGLIK